MTQNLSSIGRLLSRSRRLLKARATRVDARRRLSPFAFETLERRFLLATLVNADITVNTTWTAANSPYILQNDVAIRNNAKLTIEEGVAIQAANANLVISVGTEAQFGSLDSIATTPGGIDITTNVRLTSSGTATITKNDFVSGRLEVNSGANLTLTESSFHGGATQTTTPIWIAPELTEVLNGTGNTFTTAGTVIGVLPGSIASDVTWRKYANVDGYHLLDFTGLNNNDDVTISTSGTLTIEAGNNVVRQSGDNSIITDGKLNAVGTSTTPIGLDVRIESRPSATTDFQFVNFGIAELVIAGSSAVSHSNFIGTSRLEVLSTATLDDFESNRFRGGATQSTTPIYIAPELVGLLDSADNVFTTAGTFVGILPGSVASAVTWNKYNNVDGYILLDFTGLNNNDDVTVTTNGVLTIAAGNSIARQSGDNVIFVDGRLNAVGTSLNPIGLEVRIENRAGSQADLQFVNYGSGELVLAGESVLKDAKFIGTSRLEVLSSAVVDEFERNSFRGGSTQATVPIYVAPELTSILDGTGNVFTTAGTFIGILPGNIASSVTWRKITNVDGYRLLDFTGLDNNDDVTVATGGTLAIQPGNSLARHSGDNSIFVNGTLTAMGTVAQPINIDARIESLAGSQVELQFANYGAGELIQRGIGVLKHSKFIGSSRLEVHSTASLTDFAHNSFHGGASQATMPLYIAPELTSLLDGEGNTFTTAGTFIGILPGTIVSQATWKKYPNVDGYRLLDFTGLNNNDDVTISVNGTLSIEPSNIVARHTGDSVIVVDGALNISESTIAASIQFRAGAEGFVEANRFLDSVDLRITGDVPVSPVIVRRNDFRGISQIYADGATTAVIDLSNNVWGTTSAAQIESKVTHKNDNSSLPLALLSVLPLDVYISRSSISESGISLKGTVYRNTDPAADLTVSVSSSDISEATVPASVAFAAGQVVVTFSVNIADDDLIDGPQQVTITATTASDTATTDLTVTDDEVSVISLAAASTTLAEAGGSTVATITADNPVKTDLLVNLTNSNPDAATIPASVTIPAGETSANFDVTAINNSIASGPTLLTIVGSAVGLPTTEAALEIADDDTPIITLTLAQTSVAESGTVVATVTRNTPTDVALTVNLALGAGSGAIVPANVVIPVGSNSQTFEIVTGDDNLALGNKQLTISASAAGFPGSGTVLSIVDDELPELTLTFDEASIGETATTIATVTRNTSTATAITVFLSVATGSGISTPTQVEIPAGSASTTFIVTTIDNSIATGDLAFAITAGASGFPPVTNSVAVLDDEVPELTVSLSNTSLAEADGSITLTVSRNTPTDAALIVDLAISDESIATIPANVTIPVGSSSIAVALTSIDNQLASGAFELAISASATGFVAADSVVNVVDDDVASLLVEVSKTRIAEDSDTTVITVIRNTPVTTALTVNLMVAGAGGVDIPATVTIPAGESAQSVTLTSLNNSLAFGDQSVTVTASATGLVAASQSITILDDDQPQLILALSDASISENGGIATGTVTRNTLTTNDLVVNITVSSNSVVNVPTQVTIPAGQSSATFAFSTIDDNVAGADVDLDITIAVADFMSAVATVTILDAGVTLFDYGDAPSTYPVTFARDGARHRESGLQLGSLASYEADATASDDASSDGNSDDGVTPITSVIASLEPTIASVIINSSGPGKLDAWIDFNQDGQWDPAAERIADSIDITAGQNIVSFTVPAGAAKGETFARVRLSSTGGLTPTGPGSDGEVEDYLIAILDGDAGASATVSMVADTLEIAINGTRGEISSNGNTLLGSPVNSITQLNVFGTDGDDRVVVDFESGFVVPSGGFSFTGSGGRNTIQILGSGPEIDLLSPSIIFLNVHIIDVSDIASQALKLSTPVVSSITGGTDPLTLRASQEDSIAFGDGWRVLQPAFVDGVFTHLLREAEVGAAMLNVQNTRWYQNPLNRFDVDRDGKIFPLDALRVINELRRHGVGQIVAPTNDSEVFTYYGDVSGDNSLTPLDALRVINELSRIIRSGGSFGEQEQAAPAPLLEITSSGDDEIVYDEAFPSGDLATNAKCVSAGPLQVQQVDLLMSDWDDQQTGDSTDLSTEASDLDFDPVGLLL